MSIVIIGVIVIALGVLGIAFRDKVANFTKKQDQAVYKKARS